MAQAAQVIELLTDTSGSFIHNEALAAAGSAIVPGMLVEETATGTVQENSSAADAAPQKLFALTALPTAGTIDDAYLAGETTRYGAAHAGQTVFGLVADSAPEIAIGDPLESAGDGTLRKATTGQAVAFALEALTNTSGANARIQARVA